MRAIRPIDRKENVKEPTRNTSEGKERDLLKFRPTDVLFYAVVAVVGAIVVAILIDVLG